MEDFFTEVAAPVLKGRHNVTVFVEDFELAQSSILDCLPKPSYPSISADGFCRLVYHPTHLDILHIDLFWDSIEEQDRQTQVTFAWMNAVPAEISERAEWHNSFCSLPQKRTTLVPSLTQIDW